MAGAITDPEVCCLARIAGSLEEEFASGSVQWSGSPFAWIRLLPSSRKRGKVGEQLISKWLTDHGFTVGPAGDSEADLVVNGRRVEVKFSTLWESEVYKFQQIRDQRYDFALCLGVRPFDAHLWAIPKHVLMDAWRQGWEGLTPQHGGRAGRDTAWLTFRPDETPGWLESWGGSLSAALQVLKRHMP